MKKLFFYLFFFFPVYLLYAGEPDSEILEYVSTREVNGNKLIRTDSVCWQINSRMGDSNAEIIIPYTKSDKVNILYGWIEDADGNIIRRLKKNEIHDQSAVSGFSLYEDNFIKKFELRHNTYPYRIKYAYKLTTSLFFYFLKWEPVSIDYPIKKAVFTIKTPAEYNILYHQENINEPEIIRSGSTTIYKWTSSYIPSPLQVNSLLDEINILKLYVNPLYYQYDKKGSWKSWADFGDWINDLNSPVEQLPLPEKQVVERLLQDKKDTKEKIKALYHYLQDYTRYVNVKIETGGFKSYPISYVSNNKYGDCKALSNYMIGLLREAGIPAYYTLVHTHSPVKDIDKDFPIQAFNHVIVTVPVENDTMYLECTGKNIPAGYLGTFTQNREAFLVIPEGKSRFVKLPSLRKEDVLCSRNIQATVSGNANVEVTENLRGHDFEYFSSMVAALNKKEVERYLRHIMKSTGTIELNEVKFFKEDRNKADLNFYYSMAYQGLYKSYGKNFILTPFARSLPDYESPSERKSGVQLDYPVFYRDTVIYLIPGQQIINKPEEFQLKSRYGEYTIQFFTEPEKLIQIKELFIDKGRYSLQEYESFYQFISIIKKQESKNINIELQ